MENKWQVQECGEESYAISDGKITIVTSDADNENYLHAIADLLNSSGYRFHSENKLELDLHLEAEAAKMELIDVRAKCEMYESALKIVQKWQLPATGQFWDNEQTQPMSYEACYGSNGVRDFMRNVANEALSEGEGEKDNG